MRLTGRGVYSTKIPSELSFLIFKRISRVKESTTQRVKMLIYEMDHSVKSLYVYTQRASAQIRREIKRRTRMRSNIQYHLIS